MHPWRSREMRFFHGEKSGRFDRGSVGEPWSGKGGRYFRPGNGGVTRVVIRVCCSHHQSAGTRLVRSRSPRVFIIHRTRWPRPDSANFKTVACDFPRRRRGWPYGDSVTCRSENHLYQLPRTETRGVRNEVPPLRSARRDINVYAGANSVINYPYADAWKMECE